MQRPLFTAEELEEIRRADAEIDREYAEKSRKYRMTPEQKERKRARDRAYHAAQRARMTPEQREKHNAKARASMAASRARKKAQGNI